METHESDYMLKHLMVHMFDYENPCVCKEASKQINDLANQN